KGCGSCHQPTADTVGPSLKKIAQAYNSVDELVKYLKGELQPKVWPEKAAIMNPQLTMIKGLSEEELKALAEYILSFK
ncbi:MAG: c-type cytochrome, partial [Aquificae bacterium]|nr:c-type cytochrome [Aquificota bacterium]